MENHQPSGPKSGPVAYRRWSFTRCSNCKALTGRILLFWIGGRLWEVVAYVRWPQIGSTVYNLCKFIPEHV